MRSHGTYRLNTPKKKYRNPVPGYVMGVFNPVKHKKKKKHRKNAAKKNRRPGIFVVKKPTRRNPRPKKRTHKKRNAAPKLVHMLELNPKRKTAHKKKHRKNPSSKKSRSSRPPMSKKKKKHYAKKRNPMKKYHKKRRRNPVGIISDIFPGDLVVTGLIGLGTGIGLNTLMNRIVVGTPTSPGPMFKLPGVDYTLTGAAFWQKNGYLLAFYKGLLGGAIAYAFMKTSPRASRGIALGTVISAGSEIARATSMVNANGVLSLNPATAGHGRNFRSGTGAAWPPGRGAIYNNPALSMINGGNVPRPSMRNGMGAPVGPGTMSDLKSQAGGAFRGAN